MKFFKNIVLASALTAIPLSSFGAGTCDNFAMSSAIQAYKAEIGPVQGSDGIDYYALLIGQQEALGLFDYIVTVSENNDDGDSWQIDYAVRVQALDHSDKCDTVSLTNFFYGPTSGKRPF